MSAPLDSRQVRAFCVLARTGSFTQTARELHLTQSGISHSMKALEAEIGCRLLDRLGKKVVLTQAGEQLLHHAEKILQEMEAARESLDAARQMGQGPVAARRQHDGVPAHHSAGAARVQGKFSRPRHHHRAGRHAGTRGRRCCTSGLTSRCRCASNEPQLEFHPLFTDELHFIVAALHPWAKAGRVERAEIPRQNYILYNKHSITFRLIEDYFRREKMVLNTVIEVGSMEATKELVKLGIGVSILAPWIAQKEIEEGSLVALPLGRQKIAAPLGHSALARQTAEPRGGNFHRLVRICFHSIAWLVRKGEN